MKSRSTTDKSSLRFASQLCALSSARPMSSAPVFVLTGVLARTVGKDKRRQLLWFAVKNCVPTPRENMTALWRHLTTGKAIPDDAWPDCYDGGPWMDDDLAWLAEALADFKRLIAERSFPWSRSHALADVLDFSRGLQCAICASKRTTRREQRRLPQPRPRRFCTMSNHNLRALSRVRN